MRNTPKNWVRLAATCEQFRKTTQRFPAGATLGQRAIDDIRGLLTPEEWDSLNKTLPIKVNPLDEWGLEVADEHERLNYRNVTFSPDGDHKAEVWLGDFFRDAYSIM